MAYLGLRANCFYLPAAPFFFSNIYSIFDYPSGPCGARSNRNSALPTAGTYLRKIATRRSPIHGLSSYAKFRRLGPVWAVSSKTTLSAATIAFKLEEKQMNALDNTLTATRFLRSTPLASAVFVAGVDHEAWEKILTNLLRIPQGHLSATLRAVASEIQQALEQEDGDVLAFPKPCFHTMRQSVDRTSRHNRFGLFLSAFPAGRVYEKDLSLLAAKLIENPDFPVVPPWHEEFATLRPWFNVALELLEDYNSDIFAHEILLNKVFRYFNKHMMAPPVHKLRAFHWSATKEAQKMMQAEADVAASLEPRRLLQIKIEDLIPDVADTEEEKKALRKVSLKDMNIPRILKYRERSVILLLKAKMHAIMRNSKHIADVDDTCICDIISQYSDDEGDHHFNDASALKNIFPQRKRNIVLRWVSSIETSTVHHVKLSVAHETYCEPLEPIGEADDMIEGKGERQKASEINWELKGCSLIFPRGHDGQVLLGYGCQADQEVSEGHFTDMISAASPSETGSGSSASEDEHEKTTNRRNSDTSLESRAPSRRAIKHYLRLA